ncbi:MAG: GumC family protein [Granulosicoccus sp.]
MAKAASEYDEFADIDSDDAHTQHSFTDQIDLQHYVRILRKNKWPIALFTAAVTALAAYYAYTATPIFQAKATILIESQKANVVSIEELVGLEEESGEYYSTQYALLKSRKLAERVVDTLKLWEHPEFGGSRDSGTTAGADAPTAGFVDSILEKINGVVASSGLGNEQTDAGLVEPRLDGLASPANALSNGADAPLPDSFSAASDARSYPLSPEEQRRSAAVGRFLGRLQVDPIRRTKLVDIKFESADPYLAMTVANTVGDQYIESYLDARMELTTTASQWLNGRLGDLKADLDIAEDQLITFKQENGLVDVAGSVGRLNEQELLLATTELSQARSELSDAADVYRQVSDIRGQPELLQSVVAVQSDPLVRQVKTDLGQQQRNLDELLNRYGERHPRVVDARSNIASLNLTMQGHLDRVVGTIEKEYQLLRQRVASIENKLAQGKQEIQDLGSKKFELESLEREVATKRSIYDTFFNRMTEASSADGLEAANARISDYATLPGGPIKPKKQLIIGAAALASLVLSMIMAVLYEQMDETVKTVSDVEDRIGVKLLGLLPLMKTGFLGTVKQNLPLNPLTFEDKQGAFFEAVNTARTAICLDDQASFRKIIVLTSSVPGEGKSTTTVNLAYSMSKLERVLVIDCDMRRPTLAKVAQLPQDHYGLSSLISGTASAKQCIFRGVLEGAFDLIPAGPISDQPLELLSSKRFEKILESLSAHYDRIIIDSAPMQAVSDALVLSRYADAVLYMVKSQDTRLDVARRGIQRLRESGAPIAGVIVTLVDIEKMAAYGGDFFYQGYYDYYGYNSNEMDSASNGGRLRLSQAEIMRLRTDDREVNLDLDFGYGGRESTNVNSRNSGSYDSEFDFTTRIDPNEAAGIAASRKNQRKGGLDIL